MITLLLVFWRMVRQLFQCLSAAVGPFMHRMKPQKWIMPSRVRYSTLYLLLLKVSTSFRL